MINFILHMKKLRQRVKVICLKSHLTVGGAWVLTRIEPVIWVYKQLSWEQYLLTTAPPAPAVDIK